MSSKVRRALGDISANTVKDSNNGAKDIVKPHLKENVTKNASPKPLPILPKKTTTSRAPDTPIRPVTPEPKPVEPETRPEVASPVTEVGEEEKLLIYWESPEARKLFAAKPEETVLEAIDDQIKLLTEASDESTDGWKSIVRVTLGEGETMEEVVSPIDVLFLRQKARYLAAALQQAKENKPKFTWDECCKKAIEDLAEKEKITYYRSSGTIMQHYRKFRDDRKFKFGYWETNKARKLFAAKPKETVLEAIDDQIKILTNVGSSEDGWKTIVKGKDGIHDMFTPSDILDVTQKALYLSVALEKAKNEMPKTTWGDCCKEAINDLAAKEVTTFGSHQAIQRYYRTFREERAFVYSEKKLCYDPSWNKVTIVAPPGKLRIHLNAPGGSGKFYVSDVNEASPLAGKISTGDRLLAIDEHDVSHMSLDEVASSLKLKENSAKNLTMLIAPKTNE